MPLEFEEEAICLSGELGTKLKSELIGNYYSFWWRITSGGKGNDHRFPTSIIEMDAATGEIFIENTKETILGSAGHALELKCSDAYKTRNLTLVLIEKDKACFERLLKVIKRRWKRFPEDLGEDTQKHKKNKVNLINHEIIEALEELEGIKNLGNSLFFFDPLLCVEWKLIETVVKKRMKIPLKTGTEFILFNFTSDWFLGREDFKPLPKTTDKTKWTIDEKKTVKLAIDFFGNKSWMKDLLYDGEQQERQEKMIELYKRRLLKWFRFILPLPFSPKKNQLYHLILCSNYGAGVNATKNFYANKTGNPKYQPNNRKTYNIFQKKHPNLKLRKGEQRPLEWKILWSVIKNCEGGIVDSHCRDLVVGSLNEKQRALDFLANEGYLNKLHNIEWAWIEDIKFERYILNWNKIKHDFDINPPEKLKALTSINNID